MVFLAAYILFFFSGLVFTPDMQRHPPKEFFEESHLLHVSGYGAKLVLPDDAHGIVKRADVLFFGAKNGCFVLFAGQDDGFLSGKGEYIIVSDFDAYHDAAGRGGKIETDYACRVTDVSWGADGCIVNYDILFVLGTKVIPSPTQAESRRLRMENERIYKEMLESIRMTRQRLLESGYYRLDSLSGSIFPKN